MEANQLLYHFLKSIFLQNRWYNDVRLKFLRNIPPLSFSLELIQISIPDVWNDLSIYAIFYRFIVLTHLAPLFAIEISVVPPPWLQWDLPTPSKLSSSMQIYSEFHNFLLSSLLRLPQSHHIFSAPIPSHETNNQFNVQA